MPARTKREDELARERHRKGGDQKPTVKLELRDVTVPNIPKHWHPIARRLFESLKTSGQADRFQNSDWAFAYTIIDDISRYKKLEDAAERGIDLATEWYELDEDERKARGYDPKKPPHQPKGGSAMKLSVLMDSLGRLGMTEVDRLKVRIELVEPESDEKSAEVIAIEDARKALRA